VSAAAQTGIYYYADLPPGEEVWCRRNLALELKQPSGETEPFRIERSIDPADAAAGTFRADIKVSLTHPPIQP